MSQPPKLLPKRLGLILVCAMVSIGLGCWALVVTFRYDDTVYSGGFSEEVFNRVNIEMTVEEVLAMLGDPLAIAHSRPAEWWYYGTENTTIMPDGGIKVPLRGTSLEYYLIEFDMHGKVRTVHGGSSPNDLAKMGDRVKGLSSGEVIRILGFPSHVRVSKSVQFLEYSKPGPSGSYAVRRIGLDESSKVCEILSYYLRD